MLFSLRSRVVVFLFLVFVVFFIGTATVDGESMNPWYRDGDFLILLRTKNVSMGDVAAIYSSAVGKMLCKRIVGLGGDEVQIVDGVLKVNGAELTEWYLNNNDWYADPVVSLTGAEVLSLDEFSIRVNDGYLFVLGDNRNISVDSRKIGCIPRDGVYGKVILNITRLTGLKRVSFGVVMLVLVGLYLFVPRRKGRKGLYDDKCNV